MALNAQEQELFDFAVAALPAWFTSDERNREELAGFAKLFGSALATVRYWFGQTLIGSAQGPAPGLPDWLNQHAIDRGTRRQANESTEALRERLQNTPDAVVRKALLDAVNAILAAEGIVGTAAIVELPRDGAFLGSYVSDTGTGGTFKAGTGTQVLFTPATGWARAPFRHPDVVRKIRSFRLDVAGAAEAGNDGEFPIVGLEGDAAIIDNAAGVIGADAGATWSVRKLDRRDQVRDGFGRAFCSRGYRVVSSRGKRRRSFLIILPFGATEGTAASVREMLRAKKSAGVKAIVERRLNP